MVRAKAFARVVRPSRPERILSAIKDLNDFYRDGDESADARKQNYARIVNSYYDVATDLYEFAWGESFHFAPREYGETVQASIARHQHYLALRLGLDPKHRVLDLGCGVGGPMREITRISRAHIVGVNNHEGQVKRALRYNQRDGVEDRTEVHHADFMKLPFDPASFDRAYAIEALCHAPDRTPVFEGLHRVLRPGGLAAGYEWCMTDSYDPKNAEHQRVRRAIEKGVGVPELTGFSNVVESLERAGLDVIDVQDLASSSDSRTPWHQPLGAAAAGRWFRASAIGQQITHLGLGLFESFGVAPRGARAVSRHLMEGAAALAEGGKTGIFTPMYFFLARRR